MKTIKSLWEETKTIMEWVTKDYYVVDDKIKAGLDSFNRTKTERNFIPFIVIVKDDGEIVGGADSASAWNWMQVRLLWVEEDYRYKGIGTKILHMVESEALRRGCIGIHLDTFEYQAPLFFKKHGYDIFGEIKDYPVGNKRLYFKKDFVKVPPNNKRVSLKKNDP